MRSFVWKSCSSFIFLSTLNENLYVTHWPFIVVKSKISISTRTHLRNQSLSHTYQHTNIHIWQTLLYTNHVHIPVYPCTLAAQTQKTFPQSVHASIQDNVVFTPVQGSKWVCTAVRAENVDHHIQHLCPLFPVMCPRGCGQRMQRCLVGYTSSGYLPTVQVCLSVVIVHVGVHQYRENYWNGFFFEIFLVSATALICTSTCICTLISAYSRSDKPVR